ncbi:MAG: hypothetical protein WCZ02_09490 [Lysobacterales bacterium]
MPMMPMMPVSMPPERPAALVVVVVRVADPAGAGSLPAATASGD